MKHLLKSLFLLPMALLASCDAPVVPGAAGLATQPQTVADAISRDPALACDGAAAHPADNQRPGRVPGVARERQINVAIALQACAAAINSAPGEPRFQFQFGRALLAQGDTNGARARFLAAGQQGHRLAQDYFRRMVATERTVAANTARSQQPRQNPHAQFEKEIGGILAIAGAALAVDQAMSAANAGNRAQPIAAGASPAQCAATTERNAIRCGEKTEFTSGGEVLASYTCYSKFTSENRACVPRFNAPAPSVKKMPDYYCDPTTQNRAASVSALVAAQC